MCKKSAPSRAQYASFFLFMPAASKTPVSEKKVKKERTKCTSSYFDKNTARAFNYSMRVFPLKLLFTKGPKWNGIQKMVLVLSLTSPINFYTESERFADYSGLLRHMFVKARRPWGRWFCVSLSFSHPLNKNCIPSVPSTKHSSSKKYTCLKDGQISTLFVSKVHQLCQCSIQSKKRTILSRQVGVCEKRVCARYFGAV